MARPRSAGFDDQRDQILVAAAQVFALHGFTAATMQQVAAASGVSKATLYHYVRDKQALLVQITRGHVARLEALQAEVLALQLPAAEHLRLLIERFMHVYASAQNEHRVLTEDVKFLDVAEREQVLASQRRVVASFAASVSALRPDLATEQVQLATPLAMLLFGMINWTFTWLKAGGALDHDSLAPVVADLFFGGLAAVKLPGGL